ncbi:hypothetical protein GGI07_002650 [Coemansia sp. Benny D115]|nr:hypothetical protein GGI07_002650 [Coemansia sp. Benny D115]
MYVPPHERLNRLCLLAAPSPDFAIYKHSQNEIAQLPTLTAKPGNPVFKLDSDVYIYLCRLVPCSTICHTTKPSAKNAKEPPMFETPRTIRRSATISTTSALANKRTNIAQHQRSNTPCAQSHVLKPGKTRSIYIHLLSDFTKKGGLKDGGARLMLPGSIQLSNGDGIHLQDVSPGSEITIKNIGIDRAQFFLVDMPGYLDETETLSI